MTKRALDMNRDAAVAWALLWRGTPYVKGGRVRGAGCDCATLLAEYLIAIGAAEREDLGVYSHDWFCHTTEERYLFALARHARKTVEAHAIGTPAARPGDLALFRVAGSRVFNHGAIVIAWPRILHADPGGVCAADATQHRLTACMETALFDPWATEADAA